MAVIRARRRSPRRREAMETIDERATMPWEGVAGLLPALLTKILGCNAETHCTSYSCDGGGMDREGQTQRSARLELDFIEEAVRAWCDSHPAGGQLVRLSYGRYLADGDLVQLDMQVMTHRDGTVPQLVALVDGGVPLPFEEYMAAPAGQRGKPEPAELDPELLEVYEKLGSGGYGEVHRGAYAGRPVAIKRLHTEGDEAFFREVAALQKCQHPALVRLIGYSEQPAYIVTELAKGPTLRVRIDQAKPTPFAVRGVQPWHPDEQRRLAQDMAEGLAYLHQLTPRVLHRDVKPANVLLSGGRAKLCDFGLSQVLEASHLTVPTHLHGGSPRYMAPEAMVEEQVRVTDRSDVWAYGCVVNEIFGGDPPYHECKSIPHLVATMAMKRPCGVPCDTVPWCLKQTLAECVDYDPAKRPAASLCVVALAECLPATGGVHSAVLGENSLPGTYRRVSPERPPEALAETRKRDEALAETRPRGPRPGALTTC